jgi:hypothetical protein
VIGLLAIELAWPSERLKRAIGVRWLFHSRARLQSGIAEGGTLAL